MSIDSVLLIGFGGPTAPEEVMPFLERVVRGRGVPRERLEEVAHHYQELGGRSPYNDLTERQARALAERLRIGYGVELPIYVGMRNWHPFLNDTVARMNSEGRRCAAGVILAAHRNPTSHDRYEADVAAAIEANHGRGPDMRYVDAWYADPRFIEANAERIEEATGRRRGAWPAEVPVLFTAHSIPVPAAERSPYVSDLLESCREVAALLGIPDWSLCYQSRSGDGRVPWLEPDICDTLRARREAGAAEVVVQPIGFLHDHVEVLYDLDTEARQVAESLGLRMHRAGTVGDHPAFIDLLACRVLETSGRGRVGP